MSNNILVQPPETLRPYPTNLAAIQYHRNTGPLGTTKVPPEYVDAYVSPLEQDAMNMAFDLAEAAMADGNPPVGAVLIVEDKQLFGARTSDWSQSDGMIHHHGEIVAYENAHPVVGRDLSNCTLVTPAVLCDTCTPVFAEGKIGKIVSSAPRWLIWQLIGKMRPREINMHDMLADGDTETLSVLNFRIEDALGLFALHGLMEGYTHPGPVDEYLHPYLAAAQANARRGRTVIV